MIHFKDFVPVDTSALFSTRVESVQETLDAANNWIERNREYTIVNIETVLLPKAKDEEDSGKNPIRSSGEYSTYWVQVIRVWFTN